MTREHPAGPYRSCIRIAALSATAILTGGCGINPPRNLPHPLAPSACALDPDPADAPTLVVLVWDGGVSAQLPERLLAPFDITELGFSDGTTPDEAADAEFRDTVLAGVQMRLCVIEPHDVAVVAGEAADYPGATIIHITGDDPGDGSKHIGQSHFDPCNEHSDDAGIIWAGALAGMIHSATFEQWVNAVANTTAHEIGHTLGFSHPDEADLAREVPVPSQEIMRGQVTLGSLFTEQAFIYNQTTCPGKPAGNGSYALTSQP